MSYQSGGYGQQSGSGQTYGQQGGQAGYPQAASSAAAADQSGAQSYGQGQSYGQPADPASVPQGYGQPGFGQPYGQQGHDQQGYGQQAGYAPQGYGQDAYGQQPYGQQGYGPGYGFTQPKQPSQGLPAITPFIVAGVIGFFGLIVLFTGFVGASSIGFTDSDSAVVWETNYAAPYALFVVAGFLALVSLVPNVDYRAAPVVVALTVAAAIVVVFEYSTTDFDNKAGAIILLVFGILTALLSIFWLIIEAGFVKVAPASATASGALTPNSAAPADASAYGDGSAGVGQAGAAGYGEAQTSAFGGQQAASGREASAYTSQPQATYTAQPQSSSYGESGHNPQTYGSQYGQSAAAPSSGYSAGDAGTRPAGSTESSASAHGHYSSESAPGGESPATGSESPTTIYQRPEPPQAN